MRHLSLGQRVRADLAGALLHEPQVISLDEPTIGMDVVAKEQVRRFLRHEVAERGCCVLVTTHAINEVRRLARRVVVITRGRIVFESDLAWLRESVGSAFRISVSLVAGAVPVELPGLRVLERKGPLVTLAPDGGGLSTQQALARVVQAFAVESLSIEEDDLEDVVHTLFQSAAATEETRV